MHRDYCAYERYPRGKTDGVGYWAEGKIFGGVVLFDRGENDQECNAMWLAGARARPYTLYSPTEAQFDRLIAFLLSEPGSQTPCLLPILPTLENYQRWGSAVAFNHVHIFRDRYERRLGEATPDEGCVRSGVDWPDSTDAVILAAYKCGAMPEFDEEWAAAAEARLKTVTPSWKFRKGPEAVGTYRMMSLVSKWKTG